MTADATGSVVLVTGAARRVGAAIVRTLHAEGAHVAIHYRSSAAEAGALVDRLNQLRASSAWAVRADLSATSALPALVEAVVERFGQLDALVNNASSFFATPVGAVTERDFADLIDSNLKAPLFLTQAAATHLRARRGCVVNIVDIHADWPLKGFPVYSAAKAGLAGLTRALALELAPEVRVNGIAPGPILWPEGEAFGAAERNRIVEHTLLQRCGNPADVADAARFLIFQAPYVTGQIIAVDGGRSVNLP